MNSNESDQINAKDIGKRLSFYLAKNPEKEIKILNELNISTFTLERYKSGKSPKMAFVDVAQLCATCEININWLATGQTLPNQKGQS